ncbi:hypothetical protein SynROS8604_02183 [Synechococcus sp. ROS8604]|nr:hypothetical protein SynROS8604_02183 [Synechococcus sp. ROS8604]
MSVGLCSRRALFWSFQAMRAWPTAARAQEMDAHRIKKEGV